MNYNWAYSTSKTSSSSNLWHSIHPSLWVRYNFIVLGILSIESELNENKFLVEQSEIQQNLIKSWLNLTSCLLSYGQKNLVYDSSRGIPYTIILLKDRYKYTQKKNGSPNKIVWLTVFGWFHKIFWLSRPNFCSVNETRLLEWTKVFAWMVFLTLPNILLIEPNVLVKYIK